MNSDQALTHERLLEQLSYDPSTGAFTWVNVRSGKGSGRKNRTAGSKHCHGYITIGIDEKRYLAHRLAWFYMTNVWPVEQIDHINGQRSDNRWKNLRLADAALNGENQRNAQITSSSGLLGVSANKKRWAACICVKGKKHYLGTFDTPDLAHSAYITAKRRLHAGCTI